MNSLTIPSIINLGKNFVEVSQYPLTMWFSYQVMIAFRVVGRPAVVHMNDWSRIIAKHFSLVPVNSGYPRYDHKTFVCLWHLYTSPTTDEENAMVTLCLEQFGIPKDKDTWLIFCDRLMELDLQPIALRIRFQVLQM